MLNQGSFIALEDTYAFSMAVQQTQRDGGEEGEKKETKHSSR